MNIKGECRISFYRWSQVENSMKFQIWQHRTKDWRATTKKVGCLFRPTPQVGFMHINREHCCMSVTFIFNTWQHFWNGKYGNATGFLDRFLNFILKLNGIQSLAACTVRLLFLGFCLRIRLLMGNSRACSYTSSWFSWNNSCSIWLLSEAIMTSIGQMFDALCICRATCPSCSCISS